MGKTLIGMIGLKALPGSPLYEGSEAAVEERALADAIAYREAGLDAILIENSGDLPYVKPPMEERALKLVERIANHLRTLFPGNIGLQLLEAANEDALRIAASCRLDFLRVEGYVFAHVGGAGIIEGCAGQLLRLRKHLGAETVRVFADVKKKHCAHALTADLGIDEVTRQSEFFLADGIIVTGPHTGAEPKEEDLVKVRRATKLPIWIGSGMTPENIDRYFELADGFIVGSTFRKEGKYLEELDTERLNKFVERYACLKSSHPEH